MDSHSMSFIFKIAATAIVALAAVFVMYVKFGQMSLKKIQVKHSDDSPKR